MPPRIGSEHQADVMNNAASIYEEDDGGILIDIAKEEALRSTKSKSTNKNMTLPASASTRNRKRRRITPPVSY